MSSEEAVKKWLVESGYPLEMEVANAFQRAGFSVSQSDFYVDPDTEEPREIDVTAEVRHIVAESDHWSYFVLNVECKKSSGKPWVLFLGGNELRGGALFRYTVGNGIGQVLWQSAGKDLARRRLPLFHAQRAAYGMAQALRNKEGNDESFRALMQVAKATRARVKDADALLRRMMEAEAGSVDLLIVFSVIVVDGELYVAELEATTREPKLMKVDEQVLLWRNPAGGVPATVVHVVSRPALWPFVTGAARTCEAWTKWCEDNLETINGMLSGRDSRFHRWLSLHDISLRDL